MTQWQLGKDLNTRIAHLLETRALSDCTFVVAGEEVKAHRVLVSAASPALCEELQVGSRVTLEDVEFDIFKLVLQYIYTDAVDIRSQEVAFKLGAAAAAYQLPLLAEECASYFATTSSLTSHYKKQVTGQYTTTEQTTLDNGINIFTKKYFLKVPVTVGSRLVLWGTPRDANWFIVNLRLPPSDGRPVVDNTGVAAHFRPYFGIREVVRNTAVGSAKPYWGEEERKNERPFPFETGMQFKLEVLMEEKQTVWLVGGKYFCTYDHRAPSPVGTSWVEVINVADPTLTVLRYRQTPYTSQYDNGDTVHSLGR